MFRRMFTVVSGLSLLLCVAAAVMWARNRKGVECWQVTTVGRVYWNLACARNGLTLTRVSQWPEGPAATYVAPRGEIPDRYLPVFDDRRSYTTREWDMMGIGFQTGGIVIWTDLNGRVLRVPPTPDPAERRLSAPLPEWTVGVAWWMMLVMFGVMPGCRGFLWARARQVRRGRIDRGECAECGYDLRGSPGKCPECGREATPGV